MNKKSLMKLIIILKETDELNMNIVSKDYVKYKTIIKVPKDGWNFINRVLKDMNKK